MKLHNTLTRKIEELKLLNPPIVTLYTCGPTVYDHAHIGNFRTYIAEDLLRRTLRISGLEVQHVTNITDVDDKTIARSRIDHPELDAHAALAKLTRYYEAAYLADATKVGIDLKASTVVRATDHIKEMGRLIDQLGKKGVAYETEDGIFFSLEAYGKAGFNYGVLVNLTPVKERQSRVEADEYDKEAPADFALWKAPKAGEPTWSITFDGAEKPGRPGWHIECSAMSIKYLGQPFDLHTGGVDLKFPHHENEIAQATGATGHMLATHFLHIEHLLVDGAKMSKRFKNFYTISDIEKKGFHPLAFRVLTLQAHYGRQLNFTWSSLRSAQTFLQKLYGFAD